MEGITPHRVLSYGVGWISKNVNLRQGIARILKKLKAVTFETLGFPQILKENKFEANSRQIRDLTGVDIESRIVGFPIQMKAKPRFEGNSRNQIRDKFEGNSRPTFQRKISVAARNVPKHSEV